ncbi:hypothetical protein PR202_ga19110 [Eleusine coracana subsp. coracana]|uniref:YTH domain-containing family protein n=1 Tax=Eleusine coracana subsp. coracana TaxID=191504 RepID=A0AAV5CUI1_ELECO|nr:hypothetical protein PR202_ga19110 [Eleusine coracana subsp. coracana]
MQVLPAVRAAQLDGYIDGTIEAPPKELPVKQSDKITSAVNPDYDMAGLPSNDDSLPTAGASSSDRVPSDVFPVPSLAAPTDVASQLPDYMVPPPESQTSAEENSSMSVDDRAGYLNHLGQWEECPHFVNAEGLDTACPMIYGSYSPLPTIGDSQPYFFWNYSFSSPYHQLPGSPSIGYLNSSTGMLQLDPMHLYCVPDELLYPPAYGFYQPIGSFKGTPTQSSGSPGYFWPGNIPLTSQMHQESMYRSGSYTALQQVDKYEGATPSWGAGNYTFSAFNKSKHEKGSLDFLNELNRGPRTTRTKKEEDSSSAEGKKKNPSVDSEQYNHPEFITEYKDAKFFVNGSGQFCGVAEMNRPVDFDKNFDYWQHKRWSGHFPVKWHIIKLEQGLQILAIFKSHETDTTILEDFDFYERREKAMLDNRMEKMKLQCPDAKAQKVVEGSAPVDLVTHISATFTKDVQLEEAKGKENGLKVEDTVATENASPAPVRTEDGMPRTAEAGILSKEIG